jgi:hypothetical protein
MPLRGSSKRPTNPIVGPGRGKPGSSGPRANSPTSTPLGISTASPPRCCTWTRRASGETAMRAVTFSMSGRASPLNALSVRERSVEVWNVTTIGPWAALSARDERLNVMGSCRCRTSKSCVASQRRVRA